MSLDHNPVTYLLSKAQLAIVHKQLGELFQQRVISLPEVLRLGQTLGCSELETGLQLSGLICDLGNHAGNQFRRLVVGDIILELRL